MSSSPESRDGMPLAAVYVTKQKIMGSTGPEDVIRHYRSMAEMASNLRFQNLLPGEPRIYTPYVRIEHVDGSDLSREELDILAANGINIRDYRRRIADGMGHGAALSNLDVLDPEVGAKHAAAVDLIRDENLPKS